MIPSFSPEKIAEFLLVDEWNVTALRSSVTLLTKGL